MVKMKRNLPALRGIMSAKKESVNAFADVIHTLTTLSPRNKQNKTKRNTKHKTNTCIQMVCSHGFYLCSSTFFFSFLRRWQTQNTNLEEKRREGKKWEDERENESRKCQIHLQNDTMTGATKHYNRALSTLYIEQAHFYDISMSACVCVCVSFEFEIATKAQKRVTTKTQQQKIHCFFFVFCFIFLHKISKTTTAAAPNNLL